MSLHNPQILGKRIAMFGEETLRGFKVLSQIADSYPVRGIKALSGHNWISRPSWVAINKISEFDRG